VRDSNIRSGPSTTSAVVGQARRGMTVAVIAKRNNWIRVRLPQEKPDAEPREGWMHNSRLREDATPRPSERE
jgi:SH3-like domain-containing protein